MDGNCQEFNVNNTKIEYTNIAIKKRVGFVLNVFIESKKKTITINIIYDDILSRNN